MLTKISVRLKLHFQSDGGRAKGGLGWGRDAKRGKGPEPDILLKMEYSKFAHMSTIRLLVEINLDEPVVCSEELHNVARILETRD